MAYNAAAQQQQNILSRIMPNRYGTPAQPASPVAPAVNPWAAAANPAQGPAAVAAATYAPQPAQSAPAVAPAVAQQTYGYQPTVPTQQPYQMPSGANPNPWLQAQAQGIAQNVTQNFQNTVAPQIRGSAIQAGGFGGSRQGIAEGLALQGMNRDIANAQANLYGSAYESDANRANQLAMQNISADASRYGADKSSAASMYGADKSSAASMYGADKSSAASMYGADASKAASMYGTDASKAVGMANVGVAQANANTTAQQVANQYALGQGELGLRNDTLDANIANMNFGNQLAGANFGLNAWNSLLGANQAGVNAATAQQNMPLNYWQQFANSANGIGQGFGTTTGTQSATGNPWLGALAGWQLASQIR